MKFLVDNALSPAVAEHLRRYGYAAIEPDLDRGSVIVFESARIRIRRLPLAD